ncbi:hypothetical protein [Streptomyces sp. SID3343]|uniref:hypothetical protein n=1 Tax=Streptomyces sp. SID3343 TaxID=2690260 RepID=UPI0013717D44|nr:hypothetical protein [Streptomyces sp. SID3343]MYW05426.1 hypothetical protein [Streptomyces sp. SID3343]
MSTAASWARAAGRWWYPSVPVLRIAWIRLFVYLFVVYDITSLTKGTMGNAHLPASLYQPVWLADMLQLPVPTPELAETLRMVMFVGAPIAALGILPRLSGTVMAVAFTWWEFVYMSYGKIDHDHFAITITLWLLPTAGRARLWDTHSDERAGWVIRCMQMSVVLSYFFAAWAKIRESGFRWVTGATFYWAIERRGTSFARPLQDYPWLLQVGQWVMMIAELLAPVMLFLRRWWLLAAALFWLGFHLMTYLSIEIHFLPTVICFTAFVPWEKVNAVLVAGYRRVRPARVRTPAESAVLVP